MTDRVSLAIEKGIATLTLDRPEQGNTIDLPMARALLEAALHCDDDDAIRCVVITGRGKLFCGGGDIGSFAQAGDSIESYLSELAAALHKALSLLLRMKKPLVTLINGAAAGAGLSLAIAGDIDRRALGQFHRRLWRVRTKPRWRYELAPAEARGNEACAGHHPHEPPRDKRGSRCDRSHQPGG